ncbi:uncharacterized protein LOC114673140 isoform X2 [Macaca mulatta]
MSPFAPQRRRRRCPRHRHCLERPHRAGGQRAVTRSRLIPRLGRRHSPQKPWAPAVYQDARRTAWFRERAPKATCRRPAPGRVPSACGNRPLHPARDAELGENLVQRGLNARAPPRAREPQRPRPATGWEPAHRPAPTRCLDRRGCKPFEVHQHGEVLLYFRSPRFIPGRGSGRPGGLPRYLGLPCRTRGHSDPRFGARAGGSLDWAAAAGSAPSHGGARPAPPPPSSLSRLLSLALTLALRSVREEYEEANRMRGL